MFGHLRRKGIFLKDNKSLLYKKETDQVKQFSWQIEST